MENAAEALKMAAWVLIFVLALSVSMNALTSVKQNIDTILMETDREYNTKYIEGNRDNSGNPITKRVVSFEAIVPTMYRALKERTKIVFPSDVQLYYDKEKKEYISYIDSTELNIAKDSEIQYFIKRIMLGNSVADSDYETAHFNKIKFNNDSGLYNTKIKNTKFIESLGIYYTEELLGSDTPDAQKTQKRIITYSYQ